MGDGNAGRCIRWNLPRGGNGPISAIIEAGCIVSNASRLILRKCCGGRKRRDLSRSIPSVVADSINLNRLRPGGRLDLKVDRLALVDSNVRRKSLYCWITCTAHVPVAWRIAWLGIFADDWIWSLTGTAERLRPHAVGGTQTDGETKA